MTVRARVIGYIPLEGRKVKTRMSKLLDVTRAKTDSDRLKKLIVAAKAFNHCDVDKHDKDIKAGAVAIVCHILRSCSQFFIAKSKEIQQTLTILLRLYRCSDERLCASFCTDGCTLVPDLLELIEINYRLGKKGDTKSLVLAQNVMDKLMAGARVPLIMVKQNDELLVSLVGNINGATGRFVMHLSMKIIANLSEHSQNKRVMFGFPGLMESIEVGSTHMYEAVREESARIMMNLALETRNKTRLFTWIDAVVVLARGSSTSKAYAIQAMGHVASHPDNKMVIVQHKNGLVIGVLLQVASSRNTQSQVRVIATRVLGSLACQVTASQIGLYPGLLVALSSLACRDDKLAIAAAMTVKKIATHVRSSDRCHKHLLQSLVTQSYGKSTEVLKWTVKGFYEQASSPTSRISMIAHKGLLASMIMLAADENDFVRDYAQEVLNLLASDVANAKNVGIEKVLRCVSASTMCQPDTCRSQQQPRSYSPSSVAHFDFDFAAYF